MPATEATIRFAPPAPYPGTPDLNVLTRAVRGARSQIANLPRDAYEKDAWKPPLPGMPLFIMAPDLVKTVLLDDAEDFPSGDLMARIMRPVWGDGMLLAQGDDWLFQRRAAAQAFRASGMAAFVPVFVRETERLIADWDARGYGQVDLHKEMKRLTFNVIIETMLSGADAIDRDDFRIIIQSFFADISKLKPSYVFRSDAYHANRPSKTSVHAEPIKAYITKLIAVRRAQPPRGDLVDLLLAAQDPSSGERLNDKQLVDNLLGFILAGYETTAAALTWTFYLIAAHQPTATKLSDAVSLDGDQADCVRCAVSETLRIYPPAFLLTRVATRDRKLGAFNIKAGQRINIPIWTIHRQARFWPDPHAFDPERFAPGKDAPDRYTYMPFGAGPRICIGAAFATAEMHAVVATIMRHVRMTAPDRSRVWPHTELALVPRGGMPMTVSPR